MNVEILKGKWTQLKGVLKEFWGKMTHDEKERIDGSFDKIIGKIQERSGQRRTRAGKKYSARFH